MKYDPWKRRTSTDPLAGIKFTAAEGRQIEIIATCYAAGAWQDDDLAAIRDALGVQIEELDRVKPWASGDREIERYEAFHRTCINYEAVRRAFLRNDFEEKLTQVKEKRV